MDLKSLIEKLITEGKSNSEIAKAVAGAKIDGKELSIEEISDAIFEAKAAHELSAKLDAKEAEKRRAEAEKAAKTAEEKRLDEKLDAKLKDIKIGLGQYADQRKLKRFDERTGAIVEVEAPSEAYKAFNDMLRAFSNGDGKSARYLSDQIDKENDAYEARLAGKATPSVSDVNSRGAFAIPTEVNMTIMQLTQAVSVMLPLVNKDNIIYQSKIYPLMYGMSVDYVTDQSTVLTETNPTFTNPGIAMQRLGAFSAISNTLIRQKGADLVNALVKRYSSVLAKKLDQQIAVGNMTGAGDLVDGIVFDPLTKLTTPIALADLTLATLSSLYSSTLSEDVSKNSLAWVGSRKLEAKIGLLENTAGQYIFPNYVAGGRFSPFGIPFVTNSQIPSTLDVGGDDRTGGTDDVLILADMEHVMVGLTNETRIDWSEHFLFTNDAMVVRLVKDFGMKVLSGESTGGVVAIAQELTN